MILFRLGGPGRSGDPVLGGHFWVKFFPAAHVKNGQSPAEEASKHTHPTTSSSGGQEYFTGSLSIFSICFTKKTPWGVLVHTVLTIIEKNLHHLPGPSFRGGFPLQSPLADFGLAAIQHPPPSRLWQILKHRPVRLFQHLFFSPKVFSLPFQKQKAIDTFP